MAEEYKISITIICKKLKIVKQVLNYKLSKSILFNTTKMVFRIGIKKYAKIFLNIININVDILRLLCYHNDNR